MRKQLLRGCCLLLSLLLLLGLWACGTDNASETRPLAASEPAETEPAVSSLPDATEPAAAPEITPGKHPREEGFSAAFNVMTLTDGSLAVSMHRQIYDEAGLRAAAGSLRQDLDAVLAFTGEAEAPLEVFIVPHIVETNARVIGSRIFCTPEDLESGAWRTDLVRAVCGLGRTWQIAGLTGLIFGKPADEAELRAWYGDETHALQLSLNPVYFYPALAEAETVRISELTARSVAADCIARDGYAAFRDLDRTADAAAVWAETLGITVPALPEGAEDADALTVLSAVGTQLTLKADAPMNRFRWSLSKTDWVPDADAAYRILCGFYAGYWSLLDTMEARLPEVFPRIRENAEREITIGFIHSDNLSTASWARDNISLSYFGSCWHEMVHQLLPIREWSDLEPRWEAEGLAEHYSLPIETAYSQTLAGRARYLTDAAFYEDYFAGSGGDDLAIRDLFVRYYTAACPLPSEETPLDEVWFSRAGALVTLLHPELKAAESSKLDRSLADIAGFRAGPKDRDGNGLTYAEATLMMEYLMDRFGEEAVVDGYLDGLSPTAQFGVPYEELYADFLAWIPTAYPFVNDPA